MAKRSAWSKVIEEHGIKVRLFERGGVIYRSVGLGRVTSANGKPRTRQDVRSLKHADRAKAERQARDLCAALAEARFTGADVGSRLTLAKLFRLYFEKRGPILPASRRAFAESRAALYRECWGAGKIVADIGQTEVDLYSDQRRRGVLVPQGMASWNRKSYAVRDGTLDSDFRWLSSVFNWAKKHKVGTKRLISDNPLDDAEWPKEKNVRRPIASHTRFLRTLEHVDAIDGEGRLRCILTLARYTGRREMAVCRLTADALLLTQDRIATRLAELGRDEGLAAHMPHGAIHWRGELDKEGVERVTPLAAPARAALDEYLRRHKLIGAAPLFPAPLKAEESISRNTATAWLLRAERHAKLPKLAGGAWHPYRRLWASERAELPDVAVAEAGGWKDPKVMLESYQRANPALLLAAVEGKATG
jgi:integrase